MSTGEYHGRPGDDQPEGRWGPKRGGKRVPGMGKCSARDGILLRKSKVAQTGFKGKDQAIH